jgi:hypothetical protein
MYIYNTKRYVVVTVFHYVIQLEDAFDDVKDNLCGDLEYVFCQFMCSA